MNERINKLEEKFNKLEETINKFNEDAINIKCSLMDCQSVINELPFTNNNEMDYTLNNRYVKAEDKLED